MNGNGVYANNVERNDAAGSEPIAIVGMSLKFPQEATSLDSFWDLLLKQRSAMSEVPNDRFKVDSFYESGPKQPGVLNVRHGHFIKEDLGAFDAAFFSISPKEAECMDPQQRTLLETTYHALENSGISLSSINGTRTSVHIGSFTHDYEIMLSRDEALHAKYKALGNSAAMLSNRISWFYNLRGPSLTVDTACSSSLVAFQLAYSALRNKEADISIVGGCNLTFEPSTMVGMTDLGTLSPDGRSFSFDHRANGYSRGEGFGVLILKRLSDAVANGDTIRAVVQAAVSNEDGRTPSVTQPSAAAQERLIREAYENINLSSTRFIEAHGTGTAIGDPIEAAAINAVFGPHRSKAEPVFVGAVKSNIGHLEGAAGIASIIKTVLVLEKGVIPPNTNFEKVNPSIPLEEWNIEFPQKPTPWPTSGLRRASVNGSGFGGANVHVVIDDALHTLERMQLLAQHNTIRKPPSAHQLLIQGDDHSNQANGSPLKEVNHTVVDTSHINGDGIRNGVTDAKTGETHPNWNHSNQHRVPRLLAWSSFDEAGIDRILSTYQEFLHLDTRAHEDSFIDDLAFTLAEKRSHMAWRSFCSVDSVDQLQQALESSQGKATRSGTSDRLGFVLTGQGAQWPGMGLELMSYKVFEQSVMSANEYLQGIGAKWHVTDELSKSADLSNLDQALYGQTLSTVLQVALVDLLRSWKVFPTVIIGHSSGEIAAAYAIGAISRESAWRIAYSRGVVSDDLIRTSSTAFSMLAAGISADDVQPYLTGCSSHPGDVNVACYNSPKSITLSGSADCIEHIRVSLEHDGVFARKLRVNMAYHSPYMQKVAETYKSLLGTIEPGDSLSIRPTMISTVIAKKIDPEELLRPQYWVGNMLSPVRFAQAASLILSNNDICPDRFLEVGPHSVLQGPLRDIISGTSLRRAVVYSSVMKRHMSAVDTSQQLAGDLFVAGHSINLHAVNDPTLAGASRMLADLPTYPFNHTKRYWLESRLTENARFGNHRNHDLLGTPVTDWNPLNAIWRNIIRLDEKPWVRDHKVSGSVAYPAAGMLVMAIEAVKQVCNFPPEKQLAYCIRDVDFKKALVFPKTEVETKFQLRTSADSNRNFLQWFDFVLYVYESREWSEVCTGAIAVEHLQTESSPVELQSMQKRHMEEMEAADIRCAEPVSRFDIYHRFEKSGLQYGPSFQRLRDSHYGGDNEATSFIGVHGWRNAYAGSNDKFSPYSVHPSALDAIFQLGFVALSSGQGKSVPTMVPTKIRNMRLSGRAYDFDRVKVHSRAKYTGTRHAEASFMALSSDNSEMFASGSVEVTNIVGTEKIARNLSDVKYMCHYFEKKLDVNFLNGHDIVKYCNQLPAVSTSPEHDSLQRKKLIVCYASFALFKDTVLADCVLADRPHLRKYVDWMSYQLKTNGPWECPISLEEINLYTEDELSLVRMCETIEPQDAESRVIVAVYKSLRNMLVDGADPLQVLFEDKSLMDDYYSVGHTRPEYFKIKRYLDLMAHKNSGMKVLEIGAGTGGATSLALDELVNRSGDKELARLSEYMYTDISAAFFAQAREKFSSYISRMKFATLNIEMDPMTQGFDEGFYDLIIASYVLHATKDLNNTLQNVRKLLKPGGKLILFESINPQAILPGFFSGLLSGWWVGEESERQWGPLATESNWDALFKQTGFSGIDFSLKDDREVNQNGRTMVTTAVEDTKQVSQLPPTIIVCQKVSTAQAMLAKELVEELKSLPTTCLATDIENLQSCEVDGSSLIFLLELDAAFLHGISNTSYKAVQHAIGASSGLLWATQETTGNPVQTLARGFFRTLRDEFVNRKLITMFFSPSANSSNQASSIAKVFKQSFLTSAASIETEYTVKDDQVYVERLKPAFELNSYMLQKSTPHVVKKMPLGDGKDEPFSLQIENPGLLNTLHFTKNQKKWYPLPDEYVEIRVEASGLNFRDVLMSLGQVAGTSLGVECAGTITKAGPLSGFQVGDRVVSFAEGSFSTLARSHRLTTVKIPDSIEFPAAAALPTVFCTAYYCIEHVARIKHGQSILIHSATGGFGQAALQLARNHEAEIFVTAGTHEKRALLALYGIPEDHIFSSRDHYFSQGIRRVTKGRGVDIVINSLSGEALRASWECVAPFGKFVEVGKKDVYNFGMLPMHQFAKNVTFACVDLDHMVHEDQQTCADLLASVMGLLEDGKISAPRPLIQYSATEAEKAFRHMQSGNNMGKIVLNFNREEIVEVKSLPTEPLLFDPDATYLIAGGLGGIGRSTARWMVSRNARHLILLGRSGASSPAAKQLLSELHLTGAQVEAPPCDVANLDAVSSTLGRLAGKMPPIKGAIIATMVLKDGAFETSTVDDFNAAVRPKVDGTWNLHSLLPTDMDFFITLSSMSAIIGINFQSNYAAGNTYQDALVRQMAAAGRRAVSLDIGLLTEIGYATQHLSIPTTLVERGLILLNEDDYLNLLEYHCDPARALPSVEESQVITGLDLPAEIRAHGKPEPLWMARPMFQHLQQIPAESDAQQATGRGGSNSSSGSSIETELAAMDDFESSVELIRKNLEARLERLLDLTPGTVEADGASHPMHFYGLDSLASVEIRAWLRSDVGAEFSVFEILGSATLAEFAESVVQRSRFVPAEIKDKGPE